MTFKYKIGDTVKVVNYPSGCGIESDVLLGDIAKIVEVDDTFDDKELCYLLKSEDWSEWWFSEDDIESYLNNRQDVIKEIQKTKDKLDELRQILETFD